MFFDIALPSPKVSEIIIPKREYKGITAEEFPSPSRGIKELQFKKNILRGEVV